MAELDSRPATGASSTASDLAMVTEGLGREPRGRFEVVVRRHDGSPVVICNAPLLHDGTPMPTLYWLVDPELKASVARLEAAGGVREAEREVDPHELARAHQRYADRRDAQLPADHVGARPSGGVGGTSRGVKCLHAHLAYWLTGDADPVGRWVSRRVEIPDLLPAR